MSLVKSPIKDFIHLFFPHVCSGCGTDVLSPDHMLCLECLNKLPVTNFFNQPGNPVEQKFFGRIPLKHVGSAYFFTKDSLLQSLIYQLKYKGNKDIGFYLGRLVGEMLQLNNDYDDVDVLVPLPLNKKRQRKRGYNQATAIAEGIASVWPKLVLDKVVGRRIDTDTQTKSGRLSRWENMQGVFVVYDPAALEGKHVMLIDDVLTTGATLEACGAEILKVDGTTLSIATLAYTI